MDVCEGVPEVLHVPEGMTVQTMYLRTTKESGPETRLFSVNRTPTGQGMDQPLVIRWMVHEYHWDIHRVLRDMGAEDSLQDALGLMARAAKDDFLT